MKIGLIPHIHYSVAFINILLPAVRLPQLFYQSGLRLLGGPAPRHLLRWSLDSRFSASLDFQLLGALLALLPYQLHYQLHHLQLFRHYPPPPQRWLPMLAREAFLLLSLLLALTISLLLLVDRRR